MQPWTPNVLPRLGQALPVAFWIQHLFRAIAGHEFINDTTQSPDGILLP
jgi:hypothetical protein